MKQNQHKITGCIVDENCHPIQDATVSVVESSVIMPEISQQVGPDGWFQLTLPVGAFSIKATSSRGESNQISVNIPCSERSIRLVLKAH